MSTHYSYVGKDDAINGKLYALCGKLVSISQVTKVKSDVTCPRCKRKLDKLNRKAHPDLEWH